MTNSITRIEKNDRHITAPRNAATARIIPVPGRLFFRFLLHRIPFTSVRGSRRFCLLLLHFIRLFEFGYTFCGNISKKHLFIEKNYVIIKIRG